MVFDLVVDAFDVRRQGRPLVELLAAVARVHLSRVLVRLVRPQRLLRHRHEAAQVAVPLSPLIRIDVTHLKEAN